MNNIDETTLIDLVRNYPLLYDLTSPLYNDQQKKEEAWNEISILVSASAYDCKTKWTRLRDNYRKALIVRNKNSGRKDRAVKYEKQLSFLNEKFSFTPRKRNILTLDTNQKWKPDCEEPKIKIPAEENLPKAESSKAGKKAADKPKPVNEINAFFEGIAETVKTFPKKIQVQLKRDIFNLVNDTESSLVNNDNSTNIMYYTLDSPMVGGSGYLGSRIVDSPRASSGSNEYTASPLNLLQTTDDAQDDIINIQIKEEHII